jgi:hypothetical protein
MPTECICIAMILLSEAASTILLLTQENQAADHLISRLLGSDSVWDGGSDGLWCSDPSSSIGWEHGSVECG